MTKYIRWPSDQGQHLVEFALVLPVLLMLLFGIVEFGIAIFTYNTIANVGREVARYGTVHADLNEIDTYIADEMPRWTTGLWDDQLDIIPTLTGEGINSRIMVTVEYTYTFVAGPLIEAVGGDADLKLRSVTSMFTEVPYTDTP